MRRFFTAEDVELAVSRNEKVIEVSENDVITSAAREEAQRKGVVFRIKDGTAEVNVPGADNSGSYEHGAGSREIVSVSYKGLLSDAEVDRWREEFPILRDIIHVANCSQAPQSKRVRSAIDKYLDNWLTVGMDWDYWVQEVIKAKEEFARLINADINEIAVSTSVSEAVASIASALDYTGKRNKIVTSEAEFPTVAHVWMAHQKYGCKVDFVPVENYQIDITQYNRYIDDKTLLTSVTHVYYLNGFKQDIETIIGIAHDKGSLVLVDAYQSLGTTPIDVKAMKIDMLVSGNLKYLFGIPGIAFIYVNRDLVSKLKPAVTGWFGQENPFLFQVRYLDYASDARRLDTGTPPVLASFAARAGMSIVNEVGVEAIADRIDMLSEYTIRRGLDKGFEVVSPLDIKRKGGTTAIKVPMDSHHVEEELKKRNIIASARGEVIRIAPHFITRKQDIDTVLEQLQDIIRK